MGIYRLTQLITIFQLVFISSYMFRPVYNGHLQALREEVFYMEYNYIAIILRATRDLVLCALLL